MFTLYDLVLFDPPSAAISPDSPMLVRCCHEMIYLCRYRAIRPAVIRKVFDRFHDVGISVLGVVLNLLPENKAQSYAYHGYGPQTAEYRQAREEKSPA